MTSGRAHIIQGEFAVSRAEPDRVFTTVLGSCISVCLIDRTAQAGGLNHFLLATGSRADSLFASFGANAMELLINGLLKLGAQRSALRAHVYGGAKMVAGLSDIGRSNAEFARQYLRNEGIALAEFSVGGTRARRITLWPASGRLEERFVGEKVAERPMQPIKGHEVELF